ncbi:Chitotriosidase-1 [Colletotrichum gloeosporioides]|uniref:chitinase n=1 Tax=Colletotrichum gloeosporioides TaxID=474922 RepID=A0A8H4CP13_COLGL|nr:Chitotriosidase-1 [Colletotrichum gloeosporioides]KAF3807414.1 Chitotriosidase-1 [Colletotrichum gloeosporioides]
MVGKQLLVVALTAATLLHGGSCERPPSLTHQNPYADADRDPLADYMELRDNVTEYMPERRRSIRPISEWRNHADILKRQAQAAGEGALLCPTGECADGSCCSKDGICGYGDLCGAGCKNNCDATAMCGKESAGGAIKCGMDLCCSSGGWCGTSETHCIGPNKFSPCQEGFGKCSIIRPKTCGEGSGTTGGRTIGYYQASNVRDRVCNRIAPSQIKTAGYSHLYFAFASIDPASFAVIPAQAADEPLMREFTALKKSGLQTWVAVGGYDFSDKERSTHTTWHDLCASPAARAAFIASGKTFMDKYGFQGMDLDWEYPGDPKRGGSRADIANFVLLLKEMRASYGSQYGISLTLPPDIWYGQYFDAKGLEPYVDHFGFMSYDLHGSWDSDVKTLGAIIRGQADVREIYNNTIPLAYADLDFSKIVFGVAWYGRGYTVSDTTCNTLGCGFKGPSKPAKCTNQAGVMSLTEIQDLIKEKGLQPRLLEGAMMKELTWDDQWIGYDDEETVALKKKFANNYCFGGTMAWSVDFNSGTGDSNSAPVSTDGQCGPSNGGTTCTGSTFGKCCSSSGWCGTDDAHCGSGCQSGDCVKGAVTTDGSCGIGANDAICGSWPQGDCCSPQGWCGNTDAHCGTGCQSGSCKNKGTSTKPTSSAGGSGSTPTKSSVATPTATEEAWDMNYNWENHFANDQKCIFYKPPKWEATQNDCNHVCKESNEANHELGVTTSATCVGFYPVDKKIPWESVGKGLSGMVAPGVCVCDNPVINWLGNTFVEMLPAMAQITCYVYIHSFKLVLEEGLEFIPEGKAMSGGMKALVNAAKLFKWTYSTVDAVNAFTHWLHPCDTDLVPKDFEDVFDKLTSISDEVVGWVKPSKVAKGSGKKGDKGYPN